MPSTELFSVDDIFGNKNLLTIVNIPFLTYAYPNIPTFCLLLFFSVGWASFRSKKEPRPPQHHDRLESASVHVSYISYQLRTLVTEEALRIMFSTFGVVLDCSIKKSYVDQVCCIFLVWCTSLIASFLT